MKKSLLLFLLLSSRFSYSQPVYYERTYGLGWGMSIHNALNGNFIIGARTGSFFHGQAYYFLINPDGDTIRSMSYVNASLSSICQSADSGFIFTGDTCCIYQRAGIYKTDSLGNIQWHTGYDEGEWGTYSGMVLPNYLGGYFVGFQHDGDGPENPVHVVKVDGQGLTLADTMVNESVNGFYSGSLHLTSDSGIITASTQFWSEGTYLTKLNSDNIYEWQKYFRDIAWGYQSLSVIQTNDGGYLVSGYLDSMANNGGVPYLGWLMKTNSNGDSLWNKRYYFPNTAFQMISVVENSLGEFYVAGEIRDPVASYYNLFIMKTNSNGDSLWTKYFSGYGNATPNSMILDSAQNPMVLGWTEDTTSNDYYIYLIKTDTSGNIPLGISSASGIESKIVVYPNPVYDELSIPLKDIKEYSYIIRNMLGQSLIQKSGKNIGRSYTVHTSVKSLAPGTYLLDIVVDGKRTVKKILKN